MVPSSAVLLAPIRPDNISAVSNGPTSRKIANPAAQPSNPSAPQRCTVGADWITMIAPVNSAVMITMGTDFTPIRYINRSTSWPSISSLTKRTRMSRRSTAMPPMASATSRNNAPAPPMVDLALCPIVMRWGCYSVLFCGEGGRMR